MISLDSTNSLNVDTKTSCYLTNKYNKQRGNLVAYFYLGRYCPSFKQFNMRLYLSIYSRYSINNELLRIVCKCIKKVIHQS